MEILSYPIGLLVGLFPIAVALGPSQAPAHLLLDHRPVCEVTARSPGCMVDLGRDPRVHLLELVRTDAAGHVAERVRRWINRPGIEPEILAAVFCNEAKRRCDFDLTWAHPDRLEPSRVDLSLDGRSVWHGKDRKGTVALAAGAKPQVAVADALFPDGSRATYTRTLYAFNPEEAQVALQAVPIVPAEGSGSDEEIAARLRGAGQPVRIVEETEGALTLVLEPEVFDKVPGIRSAPSELGRHVVEIRSPTGALSRAMPVHIIVPDENLSSFVTTTSGIGRKLLVGVPRWSRVADAVAAAGYALGGSPQRRALVLVLGGFDRPNVSNYSAAQAQAYLSQVMVPLEVWRIGSEDIAPEWPAGRVIRTLYDLYAAFHGVTGFIKRQRIAWLEGTGETRPAGNALAPGIALAGRVASDVAGPARPAVDAAAPSLPSTGPDGGAVHAVASAGDGSIAYAATYAGVFRSRDGGGTWTDVSVGLPGTPVRCLAANPERPDSVFAGTESGLFRSEDAGGRWLAGRGVDGAISALALDSSSRGPLYVGTSDRGIYRSEDGGKTLLATTLTHGDVRAIAVHPRDRTVWAAVDGGVFRSADRGWTWTSAGTFGDLVLGLAFDARGAALYAATAGDGLSVTTDSGATWKKTALANAYLTSILTSGPGGGLLAGSPDGIFASSGARWTLSRVGAVESLAAIRPGAWIAGAASGILRADTGHRWVESNAGLTARSVHALAIAPGSSAPLLAATSTGLFARGAEGRWDPLPGTPGTSAWYSIAAGGGTGGAILAGSAGEIGRGSADAWSWFPTPAVFGLAASPGDPGLACAATRGGILRSEDGGVSWKDSSSGLAKTFALQLAFDAASPSTLYAGTAGAGVFRSGDGGKSWKAGGRELSRAIVRSLAGGVGAAGVLYAGTDGGVFGSVTGGKSWTALVDGLPRAPVYALAADPAAPLTLYAGTAAGLYVTFDAGKAWKPVAQAPIAPITALSLDGAGRVLHVATLGAGVFDLPLAP